MKSETQRESYDRARREFDGLSLEDKAVFIVEATASTMARGLQKAGHALAEEMDEFFKQRREERRGKASSGAAEPETGKQQAGPTSSNSPEESQE